MFFTLTVMTNSIGSSTSLAVSSYVLSSSFNRLYIGHYSFLDQSVSICIKGYQNFVKLKHTIITDVHYVFVY